MTEKIRLTKEQSECINYLNMHFYNAFDDIVHRHLNDGWSNIAGLGALNKLNLKELTTALLVGYDVEYTPEDLIRDRWDSITESSEIANKLNDKDGVHRCSGLKEGIKFTLNTLNIKIKGINA